MVYAKLLLGILLGWLLFGSYPTIASPNGDRIMPEGSPLHYQFTGVIDHQHGAATVIHCTNLGPRSSQLWMQISDFDNQTWGTSALINVGHTVTLGTRETSFFVVRQDRPGVVTQGTIRIHTEHDVKLICSAQSLDPHNQIPHYVYTHRLYNPWGVLAQHARYNAFLPITRR